MAVRESEMEAGVDHSELFEVIDGDPRCAGWIEWQMETSNHHRDFVRSVKV